MSIGHDIIGAAVAGIHEHNLMLSRAVVAEARVKRLAASLRCFLEDERFQVGVGGNPIAVEKMIAQARAALAEIE